MTHRIADQLAATLAGMLIGVMMVAAIVPDAWAPLASPAPTGAAVMLGAPAPRPALDAGRLPSSAAIGTRPAPTEVAADLASLRGTATWYDYRRGHAAAGPELRRALGAGWRGTAVLVCADRCVRVVLSDWCACPGGRVVDLDRRSFAVLAPPSVGVLPVTVQLATIAPPATSTEETP